MSPGLRRRTPPHHEQQYQQGMDPHDLLAMQRMHAAMQMGSPLRQRSESPEVGDRGSLREMLIPDPRAWEQTTMYGPYGIDGRSVSPVCRSVSPGWHLPGSPRGRALFA